MNESKLFNNHKTSQNNTANSKQKKTFTWHESNERGKFELSKTMALSWKVDPALQPRPWGPMCRQCHLKWGSLVAVSEQLSWSHWLWDHTNQRHRTCTLPLWCCRSRCMFWVLKFHHGPHATVPQKAAASDIPHPEVARSRWPWCPWRPEESANMIWYCVCLETVVFWWLDMLCIWYLVD